MVWNFILYLLYGLAFFTLGVAILSQDTRLSELGIARILWLLAIFGIIHGFHEWLELLEQLNPDVISPSFALFRLLLVSASFIPLLYFGVFLIFISIQGDQALEETPLLTRSIIAIAILIVTVLSISFDIQAGTDIYIRRMIAFPGGVLAGVGLVIYSRTVQTFSKQVARNFIFAGGFMISYSICTGIIPSDYIVPIFNVEIIILRGGSAFFIMFFTIRALSVFSLEQRRIINEQLLRFAQSEKLTSMGILAAGIAHEINNPLTNASLNLEMLKDIVGGEKQVNRRLDSIDRNIGRASTIAKELLHFSRDKDTSFEPVKLNDVILSSVSLIKNQKLSSIIKLKLAETSDIMGIPYKLEEVFINLLMNSIDACKAEDSIDIESYQQSNHVIVSITDTGHGIHPDVIMQVFDPFFTTKDVGKGTGLGLSVCYNIIKQHRGDISLFSSEDGGAVITVKLPVVASYE